MNTYDGMIDQFRRETDHFKKAQIIDSLRRDACLSVKDIAEKIDKHPSYVSHLNRLLRLPPLVIDSYYNQQISLSHLLILSRLKSTDEMEKAYEQILAQNLTSVQTEELVRMKKYNVETSPEHVTEKELASLLSEVKEKYADVTVKVIQTRIKGKVTIEMKGNSDRTSAFLRDVLTLLSTQQTYPAGQSVSELVVLD